MRVTVRAGDFLNETVVIDAEKVINDFYYEKFFPNVRIPKNLDQNMYQLIQTFKIYVMR